MNRQYLSFKEGISFLTVAAIISAILRLIYDCCGHIWHQSRPRIEEVFVPQFIVSPPSDESYRTPGPPSLTKPPKSSSEQINRQEFARSHNDNAKQKQDWHGERSVLQMQCSQLRKQVQDLLSAQQLSIQTRAKAKFLSGYKIIGNACSIADAVSRMNKEREKEKKNLKEAFDRRTIEQHRASRERLDFEISLRKQVEFELETVREASAAGAARSREEREHYTQREEVPAQEPHIDNLKLEWERFRDNSVEMTDADKEALRCEVEDLEGRYLLLEGIAIVRHVDLSRTNSHHRLGCYDWDECNSNKNIEAKTTEDAVDSLYRQTQRLKNRIGESKHTWYNTTTRLRSNSKAKTYHLDTAQCLLEQARNIATCDCADHAIAGKPEAQIQQLFERSKDDVKPQTRYPKPTAEHTQELETKACNVRQFVNKDTLDNDKNDRFTLKHEDNHDKTPDAEVRQIEYMSPEAPSGLAQHEHTTRSDQEYQRKIEELKEMLEEALAQASLEENRAEAYKDDTEESERKLVVCEQELRRVSALRVEATKQAADDKKGLEEKHRLLVEEQATAKTKGLQIECNTLRGELAKLRETCEQCQATEEHIQWLWDFSHAVDRFWLRLCSTIPHLPNSLQEEWIRFDGANDQRPDPFVGLENLFSLPQSKGARPAPIPTQAHLKDDLTDLFTPPPDVVEFEPSTIGHSINIGNDEMELSTPINQERPGGTLAAQQEDLHPNVRGPGATLSQIYEWLERVIQDLAHDIAIADRTADFDVRLLIEMRYLHRQLQNPTRRYRNHYRARRPVGNDQQPSRDPGNNSHSGYQQQLQGPRSQGHVGLRDGQRGGTQGPHGRKNCSPDASDRSRQSGAVATSGARHRRGDGHHHSSTRGQGSVRRFVRHLDLGRSNSSESAHKNHHGSQSHDSRQVNRRGRDHHGSFSPGTEPHTQYNQGYLHDNHYHNKNGHHAFYRGRGRGNHWSRT